MSEDEQKDPVLKALEREAANMKAGHAAFALEAGEAARVAAGLSAKANAYAERMSALEGAIELHKALKGGTAAIVPGPKVRDEPWHNRHSPHEHPDERATASDDAAPQPAGPTRCVALDYDRTRVSPHPKTVYLKAGEALAYDFVKGRWYTVAVHPAAARSYI